MEEHYEVDKGKGKTIYKCKICKRRWELRSDKLSVGSSLFLLDHAASHGLDGDRPVPHS